MINDYHLCAHVWLHYRVEGADWGILCSSRQCTNKVTVGDIIACLKYIIGNSEVLRFRRMSLIDVVQQCKRIEILSTYPVGHYVSLQDMDLVDFHVKDFIDNFFNT